MTQIQAAESSPITKPLTSPTAQKRSKAERQKRFAKRQPPQRVEIVGVRAPKNLNFTNALMCLAEIGAEAKRREAACASLPTLAAVDATGSLKPLTTTAEDVAGETLPG